MSVRKLVVPIIALVVFLLLWEALVWFNDWPNLPINGTGACF